jgi:hypothetical protein
MVVLKLGRGKGPKNWGKGLSPGQAGKYPKDWGKARGSRKGPNDWEKPIASEECSKDWEYDRSQPAITNGWVCRVTEEDSDWLGSSTGPHKKEVWTRKYARLCSKALISYGYK